MDFISKALNLPDLFVSPQPDSSSSQSAAATSHDEMDSGRKETSQFGSALETMDRFLENENGNLLVQSLVSLEAKTNISRRYLARFFLLLLAGYFIFSNSVLDFFTHLLTFLLPSYRSWKLLNNPDLTREELSDLLKYWIFIGLYASFDFAVGLFIPFGSVLKLIFIIQCVLPRKSPAVEFAISHVVNPLFRYLESNNNIQQVNEYMTNIATNLKNHHE